MGEGETGVDGSGDLNAREVVGAAGRASASLGLAVRASILTDRRGETLGLVESLEVRMAARQTVVAELLKKTSKKDGSNDQQRRIREEKH